jgi:NodT family efflux transporter outer membrane factor (OMF) lipoprotein
MKPISPLAAALALALAACNVGPTYKRADLPKAPGGSFKENTEGSADAREDGWRQAAPTDTLPRGKWWTIFGDANLSALEERVALDDQNIKQSFENYQAARALVRNARAALYPQISLNPSVTGSGTSSGSGVLFGLPLQASWEPDLWGKIRNTITQQENLAQISAANLANETLSEQASLAQIYFELREQDALLELYARTIDNYKESLRLTHVLARTGIDSEQDVAQAEVTLHTAEATATAVATARAQYEHAIALLVGEVAGDFAIGPLPLDASVPAVPVGVPSQILERRPDIAAAERTMSEENALIGVGKAAYYPDVTLNGSIGTQAANVGKLFSASSNYWSAGAAAAQPILDWGARKATVEQYEAQYRAAVASYRQTVLNAFKEVEDALVSSRQLAEQAARQKRAVKSAETYERLANTRYKTGVDTYLNVITAQTSLLNSRQTLVTLQANRIIAAVQLVQALGGGWHTGDLPTEKDTAKSAD